ncbi:MAG TPA: hypothetical protein VL172_02510, partial [Kofleriaceae bacterium]|nr:hypothetical protein [Kofleriaceae bacterium]
AWCAISTLDWTSILFGWPPWLRYQGHWKLAVWTDNIVNLAVPLALLALAHRAWRSMSGMRLAVLALGVSWSFGLPLWAIAARSFDPSWVVAPSLGWSLLLIYGAAAATLLGLAAALRRAAGAVDAGEDDGYRGWSDVAAGLRVYGDALAWRIGLTFVGLLLLFMAGMARSVALAGLFGALLPFALLLSALVMLAGLARYASQPPGSPGRAPAWIAFAGLVMGMALDLFGLVIVIKMIGGSREHLTEALRDRSTSLTRWGLICGGVSFASLLISFAAVAVHLRRPDMLRKVVGLVTFLILASAVLAAFLVYGVSDLGTAVLAVIGLLILLLLFALAYLRLVRTMEGAVALGGDGGLPQARVV